MNNEYSELLSLIKEVSALRASAGLLGWDQETHMPSKAGELRAEMLATLAKTAHQKACHPRLFELLNEAKIKVPTDSDLGIIIRESLKEVERTRKIPEKLAEEMSRTESLAQQAWAEARTKNLPNPFNPWLEKMFHLKRELAACLSTSATASPYDALLDTFEPGMTVAQLKPLFDDLKKSLTPILEAGKAIKQEHLPKASYDIDRQKRFNMRILELMHFDLDAGRLDESAHPFCSGTAPYDIRLTTRFHEDDPMSSVFSVMHEGGHGLYEQGLPVAHAFTPLCEATSLGIHESQSRLWENTIGRSRAFWEFCYPEMTVSFPELKCVPFDRFMRAINPVCPSFIRVESDEVTYNFHIILRFELELALLEGRLEVKDLEAAWNDGMKRLLGIVPKTATEGYLQDVHWSCGLIGYFPTYTLGNLYSSQLYETAEQELGGAEAMAARLRRGELLPLCEWLREKVHRHGRRYSAVELITQVTQKAPSADAFIRHLSKKVQLI